MSLRAGAPIGPKVWLDVRRFRTIMVDGTIDVVRCCLPWTADCRGVTPMGIDRLTRAADAAGYAMANAEELLVPAPLPKKNEAPAWRTADPATQQTKTQLDLNKLSVMFREWWLSLSSRAAA